MISNDKPDIRATHHTVFYSFHHMSFSCFPTKNNYFSNHCFLDVIFISAALSLPCLYLSNWFIFPCFSPQLWHFIKAHEDPLPQFHSLHWNSPLFTVFIVHKESEVHWRSHWHHIAQFLLLSLYIPFGFGDFFLISSSLSSHSNFSRYSWWNETPIPFSIPYPPSSHPYWNPERTVCSWLLTLSKAFSLMFL